jgi:hypothetical protein
MAITNAQQYQQLVNKPADGKRPGYRGIGGYQEGKSAPSSKSSSSSKSSKSSSGGGGGGGADASRPDFKPPSSPPSKTTTKTSTPPGPGGKDASTQSFDKSLNPIRPGGPIGRDDSGAKTPQEYIGGTAFDVTPETREQRDLLFETANQQKTTQTEPQLNILDQIINFINPAGKREQFYNLSRKIPGETKRSFKNLNDYRNYLVSQGADLSTINRLMEGVDEETPIGFEQFEELAYDYEPKGITDIDKLREIFTDKTRGPFDKITAVPQNFSEFMLTQKNSPHLFTSGDIGNLMNMNRPKDLVNPKTGELYTNLEFETLKRNIGQDMGLTGRDGDQPIIPLTPYQGDVVEDEVDPNSLAGLIANRGLAYRFMADGGRAGFMGGGMPYEGGIMDLESARQMYGLGKLVKKATGAIKKIVKSPVGKAALLYFGGNALMNKSGGLGIKDFLTRSFLGKEVRPGDRTGGIFQFMKDNPLLTIAGGSTLAGLLSSSEDEDEVQPYYRGPGLDIDAIRRDPYGTKGPAYGFYAEGGNVKEPVAKNTMRLLDMNGMEKDYRADGGFVPIGRMERADDVPARLSKNEFVFTADAVRNAGDGDIDKGAEVMYNMMKNLEAGGDISEESQGLNGARDMFQTSKRLEEVL